MAMTVENSKMTSAKASIDQLVKDFKTAGGEFIDALNTKCQTFKGATKDSLFENKIGQKDASKEGQLAYFVQEQIPKMIDDLGSLLEGNRQAIIDSDKKLAEAIAGNKG